MQVGESVIQYVDRVGMLKNLLVTFQKNFDDEDRMRTRLRFVHSKNATTRGPIFDFAKKHH